MSAGGRDTVYPVDSGDILRETNEAEVIAIDLTRGSADGSNHLFAQAFLSASIDS